jgi:hypothetical protein
MENGEWRMENGEWRMENGEWRMENGLTSNFNLPTPIFALLSSISDSPFRAI